MLRDIFAVMSNVFPIKAWVNHKIAILLLGIQNTALLILL